MRVGCEFTKGLLIAVPFFLASAVGHCDEWRVDQENFNPQRPPQLVLSGDGRPVVGFFDKDDNILVRPFRGDAVAINTNPERGKPSGLVLHAAGERVHAAWREVRRGVSRLLLRTSADGGRTWLEPEILLDEATQPLKRILLAGDSTNVHAVWLGAGEPPLAEPPVATVVRKTARPEVKAARSYHIYARSSADGGKTWGSTYRLTEGYEESIWPTLIARGPRAYSFSWSQRDGRKLLLFTKTQNGSDWQTPAVVAEVGDVLLLEPRLLGDRLLILWLGEYPGKGYIIEGAVSEDDGTTWSRFRLEDSLGLDVANMDTAVDGNTVYLTFSARSKNGQEASKLTVYFARSTDGGRHWSGLTNLRHYPFPYTTARYPRVTAAPKVVVVWNDFRNIRGDLYYNFSSDNGLTWLPQDVPLGSSGQRNDYLFPFNSALERVGDSYYLLAGRYAGDLLSGEAALLLYRFTPSAFSAPENLRTDTSSQDRIALLEQRAKRFWTGLTSADYETTYTLFDPFYRASFRKVDYLSSTGRIQFHSFEIKNVAVAGNLGRVIVDYEYEIPTLLTRQGQVSRPRISATQTENWLFIDGDWFKEYHNELGEFSLVRY